MQGRFLPALLGVAFILGAGPVSAQTMMEAVAKPAAPPPATNAPPAAPLMPAANKPAPPPLLPELDVDRYGKILTPGDEPAHPIKLSIPFPGIGEVKIPSPNEVAMRQKLEHLASMSDDEIRTQLAQWPAFSKMSLTDEGTMLTRIQQFRDRRTKLAQQKAHDLGLVTLNVAQQARFEKEYWDMELKLDDQLSKQFTPAYKAAQTKMQQDLFREFSSIPLPPPAKPPSPPAPAVTQANPPPAPAH